jgi:hypothetical protein
MAFVDLSVSYIGCYCIVQLLALNNIEPVAFIIQLQRLCMPKSCPFIRSACRTSPPSLITTPLMHGGQAQILVLMTRLKKVSIPSSFWELGPFGITAVAECLMGFNRA